MLSNSLATASTFHYTSPMALTPFRHLIPRVHIASWIHDSAQLLGDVVCESGVNIWPTCVLRGDCGQIFIGENTNIQDGTIIHATHGVSTTHIGKNCTIGHRVILHGCNVGDNCLIGMGSILLDNVEIGENSFVAAGTLIPPGKKFGPNSFIMGSPGKLIRVTGEKELKVIADSVKGYCELANAYRR
jgi:carbonic anhydrase/acetyltransferase-like protein (isoleucine patch superfamily)